MTPGVADRMPDRQVPVTAPTTARSGARATSAFVAFVAAILVLFGTAAPAIADPDPDGAADSSLAGKLAELSRAYYDTQATLEQSRQRQTQIKTQLDTANAQLASLSEQVSKLAAARYKGTNVAMINVLLAGHADTQEMLSGAALNEFLLWRDDTLLRQVHQAKQDAATAQELLDREVQIQAEQLAALDMQKRDAEKALMAAGGMLSEGFPIVADRAATPAQRNSAGGFSQEGCTQNDPTTQRCITPRTYHMLLEAQQAGFTHHTSCYRDQSWGEHPLGRACDFSAHDSDFQDVVASGADRTYGNELASWAVYNASALGVLYVIWFRQIWTPAAGWHHYSREVGNDPSTDHTNHVHISMY
jgi:hypothetical protein